MKTELNSDKVLHTPQEVPIKKQGNKKEHAASGIEYHDFMPKHSNHGRSNARTFGQDHEPGTLR